MRLSDDIKEAFRQAQKDVFGDSTIVWHVASTTSDARGSKVVQPSATGTTYADCNVTTIGDDVLIQSWGMTPGQDIVVVRMDGLPSGKGDFVKYDGKYYRVKQRYDTSLSSTVYCELWQGA